MSIEEHLIENALVAQEAERQGKKHYFFESECNQEMAKRAGISLEIVWKMATYVTYTWVQMHGWELEDDLTMERVIARLREEYNKLLPDPRPDAIVYNMGYAAAIRDLEKIVAEEQAGRSEDNGKSE